MHEGRGGAPKYARIAAELRGRIFSGELPAGRGAPPEPELCDTYGVSKTTAAKAMDLLAGEGLITRQPGAGSFVAWAPDAAVLEAGPGTRITVEPASAADRGVPAGVPVLVVERPGSAPERHRADITVIMTVAALGDQGAGHLAS